MTTLKELHERTASCADYFGYEHDDLEVLVCKDGEEFPIDYLRLKSKSSPTRSLYLNCYRKPGDTK